MVEERGYGLLFDLMCVNKVMFKNVTSVFV